MLYVVGRGDTAPMFLGPEGWVWKFDEALKYDDPAQCLLAAILAGADIRRVCPICEGVGYMPERYLPPRLVGEVHRLKCPDCKGAGLQPRVEIPVEATEPPF